MSKAKLAAGKLKAAKKKAKRSPHHVMTAAELLKSKNADTQAQIDELLGDSLPKAKKKK